MYNTDIVYRLWCNIFQRTQVSFLKVLLVVLLKFGNVTESKKAETTEEMTRKKWTLQVRTEFHTDSC